LNTNTNVTRVLCFGDSNTWGRGGAREDRFPANLRWTGLLQEKLGSDYEILEEGLRSRTTNLEDDDPQFPGRNGQTYLRPCLESQYPLDIVIVWLGTNDFKAKFDRTPQQVASAILELVDVIQSVGQTAQNSTSRIVLVSPPVVREEALKVGSQFVGAGEKSRLLAPLIQQVAIQQGCEFVNLADYVEPGEADGIHLELESQAVVAEVIYQAIQDIQNNTLR
jgi:lysophospholipase L1-like esterase